MPNKKYERGRASEYRVQRELEAEGFETIRTAGSHGVADVIAWNGQLTRFVQVKTFTTTKVPTFTDDMRKIHSMTLPPFSQVELWVRKIGQKGWLKQEVIRCRTATPTHSSTQCSNDWANYMTERTRATQTTKTP